MELEFSSSELGFPFDIERFVDDFVLFCMLIGNDFLPSEDSPPSSPQYQDAMQCRHACLKHGLQIGELHAMHSGLLCKHDLCKLQRCQHWTLTRVLWARSSRSTSACCPRWEAT